MENFIVSIIFAFGGFLDSTLIFIMERIEDLFSANSTESILIFIAAVFVLYFILKLCVLIIGKIRRVKWANDKSDVNFELALREFRETAQYKALMRELEHPSTKGVRREQVFEKISKAQAVFISKY